MSKVLVKVKILMITMRMCSTARYVMYQHAASANDVAQSRAIAMIHNPMRTPHS